MKRKERALKKSCFPIQFDDGCRECTFDVDKEEVSELMKKLIFNLTGEEEMKKEKRKELTINTLYQDKASAR